MKRILFSVLVLNLFSVASLAQEGVMTKVTDSSPKMVTVPDSLQFMEYHFLANCRQNDYVAVPGPDKCWDCDDPLWIGCDGDDIYVKGLSYSDPSYIVKGTKDSDGKYIIPGGCLGDNWHSSWNLCNDIHMDYDENTQCYSTSETIKITGSDNSTWIKYSNVKWVTNYYITNIGNITQTPSDNRYYGLDGRVIDIKPTRKGIYIHNGKKMVIR